jgi:predicted protein tyrosine phosphatase
MQIFISPQKEANYLAKKIKPTHIISISDPQKETPFDVSWGEANILRLKFYDVQSEDIASRMNNGEVPTREIVKKIYSFGKTLEEESILLIHCFAGISRSPAAGIIALTSKHGALGASKVVGSLNIGGEIGYEKFYPNNLMIQYFDDLIGFDGEFFELIGDQFFKQ